MRKFARDCWGSETSTRRRETAVDSGSNDRNRIESESLAEIPVVINPETIVGERFTMYNVGNITLNVIMLVSPSWFPPGFQEFFIYC